MFKLHTFGGLSLTQDGQPCERSLIQRRQLALLAALATAGASGLSRDKLIGLMWPDRANDRARNLLDQALYAARRVCGQSVFVTSQTALALNPAVLTSDVGEFNEALARDDATAAVAIYSGPFLDGLLLADAAEFEQWVSMERARLAREYLGCLESLAFRAEEREQWHEAARWWRRAVDSEPFSGRAAHGLIGALARSGDRAGALDFARAHEAVVRHELGTEVDPKVAALVAAVRSGEAFAPGPANARNAAADTPAASVAASAPPATSKPRAPKPDVDPPGQMGRRATDPLTMGSAPPVLSNGNGSLANAQQAAGAPVEASNTGARSGRRWLALVLVVVVVLAVAGSGISWWRAHSAAVAGNAPTPPPPSIAVLPFRNLGPSASDEYFSDGMTEELIAELSRLEGVRVVARTSSFAFKGKPMDVREIGRALNVTNILEGTVRRIESPDGVADGRLRVTAELVDARTGYQVWAEQFDRPAGDVLAIQDEISESIMQSLQREFASGNSEISHRTPSPAAYDLYLRGRYAWHQRTPEGLHLAASLFDRAVQTDPAFAPAYAALGATYVILPLYDPYAQVREMYSLADSAATHALALDSTLSEPYAVLGLIRARRYEWRAAERAYRQALARNPNSATAHQWYGKALAHQGRLTEAEAEVRRALALDPLSAVTMYNLGQVLYAQRRFDDAAAELSKALATAPTLRAAHATLGYVRLSQGRKADALREFELAAGPASGRANSDIAVLAYGYASVGQRDSARKLLAVALRGRAANPATAAATSASDIAIAFMALGEPDSAFAWLERARIEHDSDLQAFFDSPILDPLNDDMRYVKLRSLMNLH